KTQPQEEKVVGVSVLVQFFQEEKVVGVSVLVHLFLSSCSVLVLSQFFYSLFFVLFSTSPDFHALSGGR
ncbi:MAG: hypothetical protein PVI46_01395, partial [Lysobacterales bacterium]